MGLGLSLFLHEDAEGAVDALCSAIEIAPSAPALMRSCQGQFRFRRPKQAKRCHAGGDFGVSGTCRKIRRTLCRLNAKLSCCTSFGDH